MRFESYLSKKVLDKAWKVVESTAFDLRSRLCFLLVVEAGLTPKEIADLSAKSVDFRKKELALAKRRVPILTDQLFYALKEFFTRFEAPIIKPGEAAYFLKKLGKKADKGDGCKFNSFELKHVFSIEFLNSAMHDGASESEAIEALGVILGHGNRQSTRNYISKNLKVVQ